MFEERMSKLTMIQVYTDVCDCVTKILKPRMYVCKTVDF